MTCRNGRLHVNFHFDFNTQKTLMRGELNNQKWQTKLLTTFLEFFFPSCTFKTGETPKNKPTPWAPQRHTGDWPASKAGTRNLYYRPKRSS